VRDFLRRISPSFLLAWFRKRKKNQKKRELNEAKSKGHLITFENLVSDLKKSGIQKGDHLLVHSSLSSIGYVENGADAVINALLEVVGDDGNLLMPSSPNAFLQLDYINEIDLFDVKNSPSALGVISEKFRLMKGVIRSEHPTEPVCCYGPMAKQYTKDHFGEITPYTQNSPFYKLTKNKGKILYLGVTLDNAGTSLHLLEDAVTDFKFPIYFDEKFEVDVKRHSGEIETMHTYVHNPLQSKKRKCDKLIPKFIQAGLLKKITIGEADCLLVDSFEMLDFMIKEYKKSGVTMYTPDGS